LVLEGFQPKRVSVNVVYYHYGNVYPNGEKNPGLPLKTQSWCKNGSGN
jgi:hypothetical protein